MALIRLLDFAILTFIAWWVWSQVIRGWRAANAAESRAQAPPPGAAAPDPPPVNLVRCRACGVHVPSGRTLAGAAGEVFCSDACLARGIREAG